LCEGRMINDSNVELDQQGSGIYPSSSHRYIALNHYFTKSLEEWEWRRSLGKADKSSNDPDFRRSYREFELHDANDVLDTRAAEIMETAKQKFY